MRSLRLYEVVSARTGVRNLHIAQDKVDRFVRGAVKEAKEPISQARLDRLAALPKRVNKVRSAFAVTVTEALLIETWKRSGLSIQQLLKKP